MQNAAPPPGFVLLTETSDFAAQAGPFYEFGTGAARRIGTWILPKHLNLRGYAHGGMLLTLADLTLTRGTFEPGDIPPRATLSLTAEFARPAPAGAWLEARLEVIRIGKTVSFARCDISADGKRVAQASGVFRNVPRPSMAAGPGPDTATDPDTASDRAAGTQEADTQEAGTQEAGQD